MPKIEQGMSAVMMYIQVQNLTRYINIAAKILILTDEFISYSLHKNVQPSSELQWEEARNETC
jgi:hypothetical protein